MPATKNKEYNSGSSHFHFLGATYALRFRPLRNFVFKSICTQYDKFENMFSEESARLAQTSRLVLVFAIRVRLKVHYHTTAVSERLYVMSTKAASIELAGKHL